MEIRCLKSDGGYDWSKGFTYRKDCDWRDSIEYRRDVV